MVSKRLSRLEGHRRKFMAVIDDTPECQRAVHYAGRRAKNSNGGLVLVYVIPDGDFQQWLGVEEIMRAEAREEAEAVVAKSAQLVRENIGIEPEIVIREGGAQSRSTPSSRTTATSPFWYWPQAPRKKDRDRWCRRLPAVARLFPSPLPSCLIH